MHILSERKIPNEYETTRVITGRNGIALRLRSLEPLSWWAARHWFFSHE